MHAQARAQAADMLKQSRLAQRQRRRDFYERYAQLHPGPEDDAVHPSTLSADEFQTLSRTRPTESELDAAGIPIQIGTKPHGDGKSALADATTAPAIDATSQAAMVPTGPTNSSSKQSDTTNYHPSIPLVPIDGIGDYTSKSMDMISSSSSSLSLASFKII
jgi:hypothetical protein